MTHIIASFVNIEASTFIPDTFIRRFCGLAVLMLSTFIIYGTNNVQHNKQYLSFGVRASWMYIFNPMLIFASVTPLKSHLQRCLFLICCKQSEKRHIFVSATLMILMLLVNPLWVMSVPALLKLVCSSPGVEKQQSPLMTTIVVTASLLVFIAFMIATYYSNDISFSAVYSDLLRNASDNIRRMSFKSIVHQYAAQISRCDSYLPNASLWWYLEAQMLPEYALYFDVLVRCLPWVCSGMLYCTLADESPLLTAHLTLAAATFFKRDCDLSDLCFAGALLQSHSQVVARMRNLPWIVAGVAVPSALLPLMLHLWVDRGTVNANYLFFQTVCMWLFYALAVVEFVTAHRLILSDETLKGGD